MKNASRCTVYRRQMDICLSKLPLCSWSQSQSASRGAIPNCVRLFTFRSPDRSAPSSKQNLGFLFLPAVQPVAVGGMEMENLSEEFLLWKKGTPEQEREDDNREREEEQKKIRVLWKPSEMNVHTEIMLLIMHKKMAELEKLYAKKLARKKAGEKGVQAHKLMAYYRKYAPDYLQFRDDWIARNPGLEFEDINESIIHQFFSPLVSFQLGSKFY